MEKTKLQRQFESRGAEEARKKRLAEEAVERDELRRQRREEMSAHLHDLNWLGGNPITSTEETLRDALIFLLNRYAEDSDNG